MKMNPIPDSLPDAAPGPGPVADPHPALAAILDYLQHQLPGYPFQQRLDAPFVRELLDDFPDTDVLEEIKNLRWYHDNRPLSGAKTARIALRRWVARAARFRYR
jgi:hypothetical protein